MGLSQGATRALTERALPEMFPGEGLGLLSRQTPQTANQGVIPGEQRAGMGMKMKDKRVVEAGMGGKLP